MFGNYLNRLSDTTNKVFAIEALYIRAAGGEAQSISGILNNSIVEVGTEGSINALLNQTIFEIDEAKHNLQIKRGDKISINGQFFVVKEIIKDGLQKFSKVLLYKESELEPE